MRLGVALIIGFGTAFTLLGICIGVILTTVFGCG
jgi:hypothetical protein